MYNLFIFNTLKENIYFLHILLVFTFIIHFKTNKSLLNKIYFLIFYYCFFSDNYYYNNKNIFKGIYNKEDFLMVIKIISFQIFFYILFALGARIYNFNAKNFSFSFNL